MGIFIGHKPDGQQMQALARCKQPENAHLLALFEKVLAETKTALVSADQPVQIHRLQGRAAVIEDFLSAVKTAAEQQAAPLGVKK